MSDRHAIEKKWAKEKYKVMMHSQKHYERIRKELKGNPDIEVLDVLDVLIDEAMENTPTKGSIINTYNHMWGYFKKVCTEKERTTAMDMEEKFKAQEVESEALLKFIAELADKYEVKYLQNSSVLQ
ncbi:YbgA family protein [Salinicoccus sp. YB14-2]|uniref:YbgA family protein n=1 Tax=Salinicoccus sp. YB14-2 TaxID=1572701 RepID=UPI000690821F|nr:YbgA family protein [Salinicoccus sp. YB14-2]